LVDRERYSTGYLAEEGITVNLVEFQDGPTIIAAMESGSIDMATLDRVHINFVSTEMQKSLHYLRLITVMH
jgi:ABC-type nitrate/sulfonate/bicarbonate transport system substrate-binding protein